VPKATFVLYAFSCRERASFLLTALEYRRSGIASSIVQLPCYLYPNCSSAVFCFSRCTIPSVPQTEKPHSKVAEERKMISDVQPIGTANHMFSLPSDRFAFSLNPTDRFAVTRVDQHLPIPWYAASASQALFSRANIFWFFLCSAGLKSALSTSASFSRMPILILDTWDQTMDGYVLLLPTQVTYRETGGVAYLKMPLKFMRGWTWAHRNGP